MAILAGIVLSLNYLLSLLVGVRLMRLPASGDHRPERMLAVHFLIGITVGGIAATVAYAAWSSPELGLSALWIERLHAFGGTAISIGAAAVYVFTWQTFRASSRWAAVLCAVSSVALVAGLLGRALFEGWAITISPGFFHWELYVVRVGGLIWVSIESLLYYRRALKRLALGLIQPIVADRFLLWGVWAVASTLTSLSEPAARLLYGFLAGDGAGSADSIQGVAGPVIVLTLLIASITGIASAFTLFLTFFPTPAYRRWVERRAAARGR